MNQNQLANVSTLVLAWTEFLHIADLEQFSGALSHLKLLAFEPVGDAIEIILLVRIDTVQILRHFTNKAQRFCTMMKS